LAYNPTDAVVILDVMLWMLRNLPGRCCWPAAGQRDPPGRITGMEVPGGSFSITRISWSCVSGLRPCSCDDHPGCHAPDAGRAAGGWGWLSRKNIRQFLNNEEINKVNYEVLCMSQT